MGRVEWDPDDRRGWKYTEGGRPVEVALQFLRALKGEAVEWEPLIAAESLENFRAYFRSEDWSPREHIAAGYGTSMTVRHPAEGMCYVFNSYTHPDQSEPITISSPRMELLLVVTLVWDERANDWRIWSSGAMTPPASIGKIEYPKGIPPK